MVEANSRAAGAERTRCEGPHDATAPDGFSGLLGGLRRRPEAPCRSSPGNRRRDGEDAEKNQKDRIRCTDPVFRASS